MCKSTLKLVVALAVTFAFTLANVSADDLADLAGKWSLKRKLDDGQAVTQQLVFKADKFTFRMMTEGGSTLLYAEGTAKIATAGGIKVLSLTDLKAGTSDSELNPVDEQYSAPIRVAGSTCYFATGLDKAREENPRLDVYKKE